MSFSDWMGKKESDQRTDHREFIRELRQQRLITADDLAESDKAIFVETALAILGKRLLNQSLDLNSKVSGSQDIFQKLTFLSHQVAANSTLMYTSLILLKEIRTSQREIEERLSIR